VAASLLAGWPAGSRRDWSRLRIHPFDKEFDEAVLKKWMDATSTRVDDRALFELPETSR
jgi:hypothetical protein